MSHRTTLGWERAKKLAGEMIRDGAFDRQQSADAVLAYFNADQEQDKILGLGLLYVFIRSHDDFDVEIGMKQIYEIGNNIPQSKQKEFAREILYIILTNKRITSKWIDKIADEAVPIFRMSFCRAVEMMAERKTIDPSRPLGMIRYFLDDPNPDVRKAVADVLRTVFLRDSELLERFINDHMAGAGKYRKSIFNDVLSH